MERKKILIWVMAMSMLSGVCFTSSAQETSETNLIVSGIAWFDNVQLTETSVD